MNTEERDYAPERRNTGEHCFFHHSCTQRLMENDEHEQRSCSPGHKDSSFTHTTRELEIITLVAEGMTNKQVACRLCISEWTVATHLKRIFIKLGVESRAAMVHRCRSLLENS